ncbi:MAG: DUF5686 family protein [Cytophagales bacterium]|nr:DUF5686 family protein [Cytophagales bacterium]
MKPLTTLVIFLTCFTAWGQSETTITGKVIESRTGTPIPFANVFFVGTTEGGITDFDGNFKVTTTTPVDSLEVRYIGYISKKKPIKRGKDQIVNFQLDENLTELEEVVVYAGENPAWPIMRNVIANKKKNDKRSLKAYEYESYTKIEIDVDNISDKFKNRKLVRKITSVLDSIEQIAGEDGKPILPIFISEAISRYYFRTDPTYRHENVIKTKLRGVGLTDGTTTSQVIGSTLQEYNFYQNWLNIVNKEFVSPIANGWKGNYHYYLEDSLYIGDDFCYRIEFEPKNEQNLAFRGMMWIAKDDYALKRIDAAVGKSANLNYIERIKIQQDLKRTKAGAWLPEKSRVVVDVAQVTKKTAGLIAKFYISAKDFVVNEPKDLQFYQNPVTMEEDVQVYDEAYWREHRHDTLSATEMNVYRMIDTLRYIPMIKLMTDAAKIAATGYFRLNNHFDIGHYSTFFGNNDIEGIRLGIGGKTRIGLSKHFTLGGYYGYGIDDERHKFQLYGDFILSRKRWTKLRVEKQKEVDQVWLLNRDIQGGSFFYTFSRFGTLTQPFLFNKNRVSLTRQLKAGWQQNIDFKQQSFTPLFDFNYRTSEVNDPLTTSSDFDITEVKVSTRWGKDEIFVMNDNERVSLGTVKWPAVTFTYTYGIKGLFGSDFEYHKLGLRIEKRQKVASLGISRYQFNAGMVIGDLPYPLLYNTIGNETPFYVNFAYNLLNFFDFTADRYAELRYRHSFEGLILNHIPLLRKLKWRLVANANVLYGSLREDNRNLVVDEGGVPVQPFNTLGSKPYVELGYGIENIFKVARVDFFHRLTYLDNPGANKFGVKISFQLIL